MSATKVLFVTGLSGAGKTTLGELLKQENGFLHFNVDVWAFGGHPLDESALVPNPEMMAKRDSEIQALFDAMVEGGFKKLAAGETPDAAVWEAFFVRLAPAVKEAATRAATEGKQLVVSFSVYLRSVRDAVRRLLAPEIDVFFVVLAPDVDVVATRKVDHLRNTAASRGLTLSQFLRSFNPSSDAPDLSEEQIAAIFNGQTQAAANGFEAAQADEPQTLGLASTDLTVEQERDAVLAFFA